ncbi:MAG: putative capsid assembly scaffolding protein [Prokaryotic dsDNA virus sp.]|nr:MAG: putative capsid assembly scaffolding protein [Prokaryotic dsDNA virus sp.]
MKTNMLRLAIASTLMLSARAGNDDIMLETAYDSLDSVPEQFRSLYEEREGKAVLSKVVGLKTQDDINRLQEALNKERNDHKQVKSQIGRLGGREVDDILKDLDRIPELEAAAKGADNIDERVAAKLQQVEAPLKRELQDAQGKLEQLQQQVEQYKQKETARKVTDNVVKSATEAKALPEATEDIAFLGRSIFEVNDNGDVVAKSDIPGVTPGISPEVWITELKRSKPYYWPASSGAGGRGNSGGDGAGTNPFSKGNWNLTEQGRLITQDRAKAEQLAKQAGTHIGGPKPE